MVLPLGTFDPLWREDIRAQWLSCNTWNTCRVSFLASLSLFSLFSLLYFSSSIYSILFSFPLPSNSTFAPFLASVSALPSLWSLHALSSSLVCPGLTRKSLFCQTFQILFIQTARLSFCRAHVSLRPQTVSFFGWGRFKCSWRGAYNSPSVSVCSCLVQSRSGAVKSIC